MTLQTTIEAPSNETGTNRGVITRKDEPSFREEAPLDRPPETWAVLAATERAVNELRDLDDLTRRRVWHVACFSVFLLMILLTVVVAREAGAPLLPRDRVLASSAGLIGVVIILCTACLPWTTGYLFSFQNELQSLSQEIIFEGLGRLDNQFAERRGFLHGDLVSENVPEVIRTLACISFDKLNLRQMLQIAGFRSANATEKWRLRGERDLLGSSLIVSVALNAGLLLAHQTTVVVLTDLGRAFLASLRLVIADPALWVMIIAFPAAVIVPLIILTRMRKAIVDVIRTALEKDGLGDRRDDLADAMAEWAADAQHQVQEARRWPGSGPALPGRR